MASDSVSRPTRPLPEPTSLSRPFWDYTKSHELRVQVCEHCRRLYHPPVPQCANCRSEAMGWQQVSGRGTVHSYTVMRQPLVAGFENSIPYTCLVVELEEQPGLLIVGNLEDPPTAGVAVGQGVEVVFEPIDEGFVLPQFRITTS